MQSAMPGQAGPPGSFGENRVPATMGLEVKPATMSAEDVKSLALFEHVDPAEVLPMLAACTNLLRKGQCGAHPGGRHAIDCHR